MGFKYFCKLNGKDAHNRDAQARRAQYATTTECYDSSVRVVELSPCSALGVSL